ncbi:MAG: class I SAM-dependent methyltransferase [Spirochaetales bacterium]|nr:class I SAM-dependent methyltransferase [Spirochaetales bacterium]
MQEAGEGEHRFSGPLAEEYELITLAYPDFESFQRRVVDVIAREAPGAQHLLEIGTGNGFTTRMIMDIPAAAVISVDNDPHMVAQARSHLADYESGSSDGRRLTIEKADALEFLRRGEAGRFDVVVSAFTLHNMERDYREGVEGEIFRVLKPGGLFVNADKYAPDDEARFDALVHQVERFFDAFVPRGKLDLLRRWVVHNIADQSPRYVMRASESIRRLKTLGFDAVHIGERAHMQAIVHARKPL